jgi:hypothetical protein
MQMRRRAWIASVLYGLLSACRDTTAGVRTQFIGAYAFTATERRLITRIAGATAAEVRKHLPALPAQITLRVDSGKEVSPVTGALGTAGFDWVFWTVDPDRPEGVAKIAETHLRATLFHECHHLVRQASVPSTTLMDHVVMEGMAAAFERDFAGASYPWVQYPADVSTWVDELLALPPDTHSRDWIARPRPDGRRWVGIRAGTYLVDRAMKTLNRTTADLVATPTGEIVRAATR